MRAVVLSWDFLVGVPLGLIVALLPALSHLVASEAGAALLGVALMSGALAALALTSLAVQVTTITPAYERLLDKVPGGAAGTLVPTWQVVATSAIGAIVAAVASLAWPLVRTLNAGVIYVVAAVPFVFVIWSLLGCVQVVGQVRYHMVMSRKARELDERRRRALSRSA